MRFFAEPIPVSADVESSNYLKHPTAPIGFPLSPGLRAIAPLLSFIHNVWRKVCLLRIEPTGPPCVPFREWLVRLVPFALEERCPPRQKSRVGTSQSKSSTSVKFS